MCRSSVVGSIAMVAAAAFLAPERAASEDTHGIEAQYPPAAQEQLSDTMRASHVLNRLTFGARPGDLQAVLAIGVDRWIDQQLRPHAISDTIAEASIAILPPPEMADMSEVDVVRMRAAAALGGRSSAGSDTVTIGLGATSAILRVTSATARGQDMVRSMSVASVVVVRRGADAVSTVRVARPTGSERQLLEVLTDFWLNHFSVYRGKVPSLASLAYLERDAVRPNALGKFRDLLGAAVSSPAMLFYLDNHLSTVDSTHVNIAEYRRFVATGMRPPNDRTSGLNENFARELLELHTLGADGGYTQDDVAAVARAFTGWTISSNAPAAAMEFREELHDAEPKIVLGHTLPAGRGIEDGEDVLDILARHPATARFVARKLAVRLVSDSPSEELVERAATAFTRTDGDISEVVRTLVTSAEFFDTGTFRAKVKSPFELLLSTRRALGLGVDGTGEFVQLFAELNQPIWGYESPEGWPETASPWMTSGALFARVSFGVRVAQGEVPGMVPDSSAPWSTLATAGFEEQLRAVVNTVLGGAPSADTRNALMALAPVDAAGAADPVLNRERLRDLLAVALSSPEFQRR